MRLLEDEEKDGEEHTREALSLATGEGLAAAELREEEGGFATGISETTVTSNDGRSLDHSFEGDSTVEEKEDTDVLKAAEPSCLRQQTVEALFLRGIRERRMG
ncbi:hypothetical protein NE237_023008 [Protea cynaroides]|uniref:Uncharacterized protein n=1 Tax=Protea cynaroides TaxID=273540 RepID=A0A9Q0HGC0_9MAGN|nr:hypothetical protein NE237_023008 [Protea cynaroides]